MGYSSKFSLILPIDCETTGVCIGQQDPLYRPSTGERHQALSWGVMVVDEPSLEIIEKHYIEVKWNDESKRQRDENPDFGVYAEGVHGLTFDHLEKNGMEEEEAVCEIANIIVNRWGDTSPVTALGHNIQFDIRFLTDMFERHGLNIRFSSRQIDSFSVGAICWRAYDSDTLFDLVAGTERKEHNALEDIELTLESMKTTRTLFESFLDQ